MTCIPAYCRKCKAMHIHAQHSCKKTPRALLTQPLTTLKIHVAAHTCRPAGCSKTSRPPQQSPAVKDGLSTWAHPAPPLMPQTLCTDPAPAPVPDSRRLTPWTSCQEAVVSPPRSPALALPVRASCAPCRPPRPRPRPSCARKACRPGPRSPSQSNGSVCHT